MIFFRPTVTMTESETARFDAVDDAVVLGSASLLIHDGVADVTRIQADDPEIGEGLVRAALNYAANQGFYIAVCSAQGADDVTARMKFEDKNGRLTNDIPTLLMGSCGG